MVFLSGRAASDTGRHEGRPSEKGALEKTTANLLIFHETAKSTISQANDFKELRVLRRSVFVSQAKFFSSQAKYFASQAKFSLRLARKNGKIRFAYKFPNPPLGLVSRIKESGRSSLRMTAKQSRLSHRMRSPSLVGRVSRFTRT